MRNKSMIDVSGLSMRFGGNIVVDQLSFTVQSGEIFGLVGPDGAGKSTTMRVLAGVLRPESGRVTIASCDVVSKPELAKQSISYMPQRFGLYEDLTVDENIRFYADLFGVSAAEREAQAKILLDAAEMGAFRKRLAGRLSGGMKQKLSLVCALIHKPKVVLLDEPTNGVDPVSRRDFWKLLYQMALEGVAILTSTAYLDEAERCHRVALMHKGKLLFCDTPANLKKGFGQPVVGIVSPRPREARRALHGMEGISSPVLAGDGVHVVVDNAEHRIPELRAKLTRDSILFQEIDVILPTLEDIFVAAIESKPGEA